jgi:hypothetical protein
MPSLFLRGRFFTGLFLTLFPLQTIIRKYASVAELVDAQDLGSCALRIRVRVPSLAPFSISRKTGGFFYCSENPFCQCFVRQKGFILKRDMILK